MFSFLTSDELAKSIYYVWNAGFFDKNKKLDDNQLWSYNKAMKKKGPDGSDIF